MPLEGGRERKRWGGKGIDGGKGGEGGERGGGGKGERDWHKGTDKKINQSKFFSFMDST